MKVSELPYQRVTIEELEASVQEILSAIENARSVEDVLEARKAYNELSKRYSTASALS